MFYQVDTFAEKPFLGNPTAVIIEDNNQNFFTDELRSNIAKEMNLSVTIFVQTSEIADFNFIFYTPKKQIPLSGHATIAAVWLLAELGIIAKNKNQVKIETKEGIFTTEIQRKNERVEKVFLIQAKPTFKDVVINKQKLADILGIRIDKIESDDHLPLIIANVGSPKLLVPISSKEMTDALVPKFDEIERLCRKLKISGIHLYTFDTYLEGSNCYTRHFEPIRGSPETVVSALANGALGAFLVQRGLAPAGLLIFEQGESLNRPSKIEVRIEGSSDEIKSIKVGGKVKLIFRFKLEKGLLSH